MSHAHAVLFLYKAGECVHKFCQHDTITKVDEVLSLHYPLPKICLQFGIDQREMKTLNISNYGYKYGGDWTVLRNGTSENGEAIYNRISVDYSDVIEKIKINVDTGDGDSYTKHTLYENGTNLEKWRLDEYCEHYWNLKCICIFLSPDINSIVYF